MALTDSVRSRQVPDTPGTSAWPPRRPSVPTSRATRVTSEVNSDELVDHAVEDGGDLPEQSVGVVRQPGAEVAVTDRGQPGQQLPELWFADFADVAGPLAPLGRT